MEGLLLMAVITAVIVVVAKARASFGPQPVAVMQHERLGELRFDPSVSAWRARVPCSAGSIGFLIGGTSAADPGLLTHAGDIAAASDAFLDNVRAFLEEEAKREPRLAEEIRGLRLEEVCLFWPSRPNDGMLYFAAANNDGKVWRSDYVDRKPRALGFDS